MVMELYEARKEAKEYLDFYINPNDDAKLEEYKKIIYNEFYPNRGEPKCRFSVCRKTISDFKKLKPSPSCIADLMLFYIETGVNFTAEYGDMTRGPRVIAEESKKAMKNILKDIQSGNFAEEFLNEMASGSKNFNQLREDNASHLIEKVGNEIRTSFVWSNDKIINRSKN